MTKANTFLSDRVGVDLARIIADGNYSKVLLVTDENTKKHSYPIIQHELPGHVVIETKSGEQFKNLETCTFIWQEMTTAGLDRHSVVIILGGGVLGDMGGFCASTFKRGLDFILVPTTLLAQVDSSIGGKLGIDFHGFKNHIGVFREPVATVISLIFLETLPREQLLSGFAEVVKHCLSSDRDMWDIIKTKKLENQNWSRLVPHSIEFKSKVVTEDPFEKGLRKILNVGHSIGHAIETFFLEGGKPMLHGEAIATGLVCEAHISNQKGMLPAAGLKEISTFVLGEFGKFNLPGIKTLMPILRQDKKNKGNEIRMALIDRIGHAEWDVQVSGEEIEKSLAFYEALQM